MSAIFLDFNKALVFLDGTPIMEQKMKITDPDVPAVISKTLATNLSQLPTGGMKMFHWSVDLYKEGTLTLDKTDRDLLKETVLGLQISNLVKGRVITIIEDAEKKAEKDEADRKETEKLKIVDGAQDGATKQSKINRGIAQNQ